MFAESIQMPRLNIYGTLGNILNLTIDALPLRANTLNYTYSMKEDPQQSIGELRYITLERDAENPDPWLCESILARVHATYTYLLYVVTFARVHTPYTYLLICPHTTDLHHSQFLYLSSYANIGLQSPGHLHSIGAAMPCAR